MSYEEIPVSFRQPFDPLDIVDHELVRFYTQGRLTTGRGVKDELQRVYDFNGFHSEDLINRLINYGKFLEPFNDDLTIADQQLGRMKTFLSATSVALTATANIAFELGINQFEWRSAWSYLPEGIDAPTNVPTGSVETPSDCFRIGAALMDIGRRNYAALEPTYPAMIDVIEENYPEIALYGNEFKASFGYVFGIGRQVLRSMYYPEAIEAVVHEVIPDVNEPTTTGLLDDEYKRLLKTEVPSA